MEIASRKPKVFIASSLEGRSIVDAIHVNIEHECEVTPWYHSFTPSSNTLDDLIISSSASDFALFVFQPDDLTLIRSKAEPMVRDNVLFEMGIFIGTLGRERVFLLKPSHETLCLPTDLAGLIYLGYEANRTDQNLEAATNPACSKIKKCIKERGALNFGNFSKTNKQSVNFPEYELDEIDYIFLQKCSASHTSHPEGLTFESLSFSINNRKKEDAIRKSALKLHRMKCIDLSIEVEDFDINDPPRQEYYYTITEIGIDLLLKHDFSKKTFDDEIPF